MDKQNALLSVFDKQGIVERADALIKRGWRIYASGGTAKTLEEAGFAPIDIKDLTKMGPILNHRVMTLVPEIHAGLLATEDMLDELEALGYPYFDLVCVDLYPLEDEINNPNATRESIIEKTDMGGIALLRSGSKGRRITIGDQDDWTPVLDWLDCGCPDEMNFRDQLAAKAEFIAAQYCLLSANATSGGKYDAIFLTQDIALRYGENPHQTAKIYSTKKAASNPFAIVNYKLLSGSDPSYINITDINRMFRTVTRINAAFSLNFQEEPLIAIAVKHGNACGAAVATSPKDALVNMFLGDTRAIFGASMLFNFPFTEDLAATLCELVASKNGKPIFDGIVAPSIEQAAIMRLKRKNGKCRFWANPALANLPDKLKMTLDWRQIEGGFLCQTSSTYVPNFNNGELVYYGEDLSAQQIRDLPLAWAIGSTSNSNTITVVKDGMLLGNGVGQQDRVSAADIAIYRARSAGHDTTGAVAYSDSFFPYADGVEALIAAGIAAIFTSSGSVNDKQIIEVCAEHDIALCMVPDKDGRGFDRH